jgi:hypothetical protein
VQTIGSPWESSQSLAKALQASFWSSEVGRAATALGRWEALGLVIDSQVTPWHSLQRLAQTFGAPYESATAASPAVQTRLTPWEAMGGVRNLIVDPWEAMHYQAAVVLAPWESILSLSQSQQLALWEALGGARATDLAPWEALGPLVQLIELVNLLGRTPTIADLEAWVSTIAKLKGHSG